MSNLACSAGVFFCVPNLLAKNRVETSQREEEIGRVYRKGYYFYSPQSSTVIESKMAATTIIKYYEHEQGFAHPKYACTAGYVKSARCAWLSPIWTENILERMFIF